ncbi:hypothetical protein BFRIG_01879 [Peribacillus frigoritolerans]|uniref:hypothetical protein n=1 Tax=Peribacillus frigoritolerans TaxID=450367 RepID=UPI0030CEC912
MSEKKKYQATVDFKDLQDKGKIYRKGDTFPKPGNKKVEEERLEELLTSENKLGKPIINEI